MKLDPQIIEGFQKTYLRSSFDHPVETGDFHRAIWADWCSTNLKCAWAAPREHAKSTSVTHTCTLADVLTRQSSYVIIVSDTESQAVKFLGDIRYELTENDALISTFGIKTILKDTETEIWVEFVDGAKFNITARGSEQKVRGLKWMNKRPDLVVIDDFENDELVMNKDRRKKLRNWFKRALLQCGTKRTKFRMVGTILHNDSILENLLANPEWVTRRYSAHKSFDDFSEILWPEQFDEAELRRRRAEFLADGDAEGYSQEYLSRAIPEGHGFFKESDFRTFERESNEGAPLQEEDGFGSALYFVSLDIATSTRQSADYTVAMVAAVNIDSRVRIVEVRRARQDTLETANMIFELVEIYHPECFIAESGVIQRSIEPFLEVMMNDRGVFPNFEEVTSDTDKRRRAVSWRGRMRIGNVEWDGNAAWLPDLKEEYLEFDRGRHDDQVDAGSNLGLHLSGAAKPPSEDDEMEEAYQKALRQMKGEQGKSKITGY